jgi:hypothetical protein
VHCYGLPHRSGRPLEARIHPRPSTRGRLRP